MKKHLLAITLIASGITAMSAQGLEHPFHHAHSSGHSYLAPNDSLAREAYEHNAPAEFYIPGKRHLTVHSNDNRFHLTIGGYAKLTAGVDFGSPIDNSNEFIVSAIPMHLAPGNGAQFNISAMQSHLYFNFVAMPGEVNQIGVFIGANFLSNYNPSLQFAYMKFRGFEAGYDYSLFSDPGAGVPTIDYEGPNAFTALPTVVAGYSHTLGKNRRWSVGGGIEAPAYSVTPGNDAAAVTQRVPDIPVWARYSWNRGDSWVRLSAVVRNLIYHDGVSRKNVDKVGWGVQLSGKSTVAPNLTAYWQGVYGNGIASKMQDLSGLGLDMTPDSGLPGGEMNLVPAWGAYMGLQYDFSRSVYCSMTYSHIRTYADRYNHVVDGGTAWADQYRYGQYAVANVFWNITPVIQTGVEYIYGRRVNYGGDQAHDNRLQCMVQLNF
ncbi:MAG: porin [Muribaculaceae bacterium]|nr:porin [Muribaculaceae bacterium]